ncbi:MAG TPA: glycosyl hydrolase family 8 [Polyangiaceae bacterium]|nr:glycosyl hydrolase family 8 [Polyangiaceae bacterium]
MGRLRAKAHVAITRFPFPHNQRLAHCAYPSAADHRDVLRAFQAFRDEIVTADGARGFVRTRRPDTPDGVPNSTVSEGIAYGMLIAVMLGEQALFDGFYGYAQSVANERGLMRWYVGPDGEPRDTGAASDADEDIAWALVMAHRQWGGRGALSESYLEHAKRQIDRIYTHEVDHTGVPFLFKPGDEWRSDVFNPSYFAPNQYRLFGEVSGNRDGWQRVVDRGYEAVQASLNPASGNAENGLVPAWCDAKGTPVEAFPGAETNYQTDSARLPFRIAQDFAFYREERARAYLAKTSAFFAGLGANAIGDGYHLDGRACPDRKTVQPNAGSAVFVGCAAAGAMHDARYQAFLDAAYARVRTGTLLARSRYYNHCWTVLSLLMLTGNFVELTPE